LPKSLKFWLIISEIKHNFNKSIKLLDKIEIKFN
jgi:hypothetical protein